MIIGATTKPEKKEKKLQDIRCVQEDKVPRRDDRFQIYKEKQEFLEEEWTTTAEEERRGKRGHQELKLQHFTIN